MIPTVTGLIVIALGIWCQFGDYRRTLVSILILTLFEAADAADLVALGGASITPSKLFLLFFVLRLLSMRNGPAALLSEVSPRRVLFVYLLLVLWIIASGVLLPQLFANMTDVFSLERTIVDTGAVPLKPSTGNITQTVYAMGGFVITLGVSVMSRKPGAYATILTGFLIVTGLNIFFALADLATWATHTDFLLDVFHTGAYAFLTSDEAGGLKRISGTFSEASSFATFSLELLAINAALFLSRVKPMVTGSFSAILLVFLCVSTSSTAYVGLGVYGLVFAVYAVYALVWTGNARHLKILGLAIALAIFSVCFVVLFLPGFAEAAWNILDLTLFQKGQSDSAIERGEWNAQSMKIFFDTYGLGAGIGSTRSSNYILVLASNLGIIGLVLFALLILRLAFVRPRPELGGEDRKIVTAARVGMLGSLVPAILIGTIFDLGTLFYVMVGIVASSSSIGAATSLEMTRSAAENRRRPAIGGRPQMIR